MRDYHIERNADGTIDEVPSFDLPLSGEDVLKGFQMRISDFSRQKINLSVDSTTNLLSYQTNFLFPIFEG